MMLNAYAILDLFLVLLRLVISALVVVCSITSWHQFAESRRRGADVHEIQNRGYLVYLLALVLLGLNVISWPFFYLLLQSFVPELPGTMCIFGVTRIGEGSLGASRFLPRLVEILQVVKPAVIFLGGTWLAFYLINRRTQTAPLTERVFALAACVGLTAFLDSGLETIYLLIPKREEFLSVGCCTGRAAANFAGFRVFATQWLEKNAPSLLGAAYFLIHAGIIVTLFILCRSHGPRLTKRRLALLVAAAVTAFPVSLMFLIEVAAPTILRLPYHHCPYDLVPKAPESLFGVATYGCGSFAIGWSAIAGWFARNPQTELFLDDWLRTMLFFGLVGHSSSLTLTSVEFVLVQFF